MTAPTRRARASPLLSTDRPGRRTRSGRDSIRRSSTAETLSTFCAGAPRRAATARSGTCTSRPGRRRPCRRAGTSARWTTVTCRVSRATGSSPRRMARRSRLPGSSSTARSSARSRRGSPGAGAGRLPFSLLREALELVMRLDPLQREHHRRGAHVDFLADAITNRVVGSGPARSISRDVPDDPVIALDGLLEAPVHFRLAPVLHPLVLDPLVVRDGDAAGVPDDVGNQLDAALGEDAISFGRRGTVRSFGDELYFQPFRDGPGDLASQRGGNEDVGLDVEQIVFGNLLGLRVTGDRAAHVGGVLVHVRNEIVHVDAVRIEDGPARVVHGQEPRSETLEDLRGVRADVTESLQGEGRSGGDGTAIGEPLLDGVGETLSGRLDAPFRAANARVLPGDDAAQAMALALAVGELPEQEAHDVGIGPHVGSGDVEVGPDQRLEAVHVAENERLQLLAGERSRVDLDAALAAAERDVGDRRLPGHLGREHLEEVQRDVLVEPDAALVGAARLVVLHTVSLESFRPAGEHFVEPLALQPDDPVAHEDVCVDERAAFEDEAAVEERLEPVGGELAVAPGPVLFLLSPPTG